jgi:phosphatidyl-myo-inositol dimannoside synthase
MNKKSLLLTQFFPPEKGGIQNYLYNICKNLPQDKIFVLAEDQKYYDTDKFDSNQPFKIIRDNKESFWKSLHLTPHHIYNQAKKICKENDINHIQCGHLYPQGTAGLHLKKYKKLPYIIYLYGSELFEIKNFSKAKQNIIISSLKNADYIIIIADFLKEKLKEYGISERKVIKIMPGVDFNSFKPGLNTDNLRKKLNLENKKIILSCARLVKRKNHKAVIEALPNILKKIPSAIYLILSSGPEKENLKLQAKKLGLENHIIFAGEVEDKELPYYYNLADVFCMPSQRYKETGDVEGFGIVFIEAQACETPTIGSNTGGIPDAIRNNIDGFLINPENKEEIANNIIEILENEELAKKMGQTGRKKVIEEHDWKKLVKKLPI